MSRSSRPYSSDGGEPRLAQSMIVVADILGYSAKTHEAFQKGEEQDLLLRISRALDDGLAYVKDPSGSKWYAKLWSDNLIIGYPLLGTSEGAFEFSQACHTIGHFQREMAADGLFVRGGIAVGPIHVSENLVFGQVLDELKEAERRAHYPRIVLLDSALRNLNSYENSDGSSLGSILWDDNCDSAKFVNYLYPLGARDDDQAVAQVCRHQRYIESSLATNELDGGALQKYKWLARYHNMFCRRSSYYSNPSYYIEEGG